MRDRIRISPQRYFVIAAVALVALTLIVFTGAAVRVTGSGLGCPNWPQCLSMAILVAAGALAWRARPAFERGEGPAADLATARAVWALFVLGAVTIFVGTAATAAGPHAGGEGTGDVVHRFDFKGSSTVNWLIDRHGVLAGALGVLAVVTWWLARRGDADSDLRTRLTRICLLLALQGVVGIVQFQLSLPAEIVWLHVALATLTWVGIVLAAMQVGAPVRAAAGELSARAPASAARP